jgi:hypothetical protein
MDTRFWGPSGWKLLHLISFDYAYSSKNAITYAKFFETIPYIIPCKFCRSSLTDYYEQHPYTHPSLSNGYMNPLLDMKKWLYTIHNCVNYKLRKQGIQKDKNPSFAQVVKYYTALSRESWQTQLQLCWDFLFAVAYHHPTTIKQEPMPDCPKDAIKSSVCLQNKWNILSMTKRMTWFTSFWLSLPDVLPLEIQKKWKEVHIIPTLSSRTSTLAWLWKMRCALDTDFKDPYTSICKKIASYSSDCGKDKRAITCRKTKKNVTKKTHKKTHKKKE